VEWQMRSAAVAAGFLPPIPRLFVPPSGESSPVSVSSTPTKRVRHHDDTDAEDAESWDAEGSRRVIKKERRKRYKQRRVERDRLAGPARPFSARDNYNPLNAVRIGDAGNPGPESSKGSRLERCGRRFSHLCERCRQDGFSPEPCAQKANHAGEHRCADCSLAKPYAECSDAQYESHRSLEEGLDHRCRLADISRTLAERARISGQPGDDVNFIPLSRKETYCSQVRALSAALLDTSAPALAVAEQISADDAVEIIQANQNERALELMALEEEAGRRLFSSGRSSP